jgi:hypothetical protein
MACRVKIHFIGLSIVPILVVASAESKSAHAQVKLDAYYTATLLGLPIGHISWVKTPGRQMVGRSRYRVYRQSRERVRTPYHRQSKRGLCDDQRR